MVRPAAQDDGEPTPWPAAYRPTRVLPGRAEVIARYVGEGKRPTRLTGSPNEAESLARIRRYVETQVGVPMPLT
jgi:hypothetical protein